MSLSEYPRPQLKRDSYLCLNGEWEYQICKDGEKGEYSGFIKVPYSPETDFSGVKEILYPDQELWYKRIVEVPNNFVKDRLILNFGAVDQVCEVFINGIFVFKHVGGYTPFSIDVTDFVDEDFFELELKVKDFTEESELSRGKQALKPGLIFYTCQSGIWQSVWMESVTDNYIKDIRMTPDANFGFVDFEIFTSRDTLCKVIFDDKIYEINSNEKQRIYIDNPRLWDLEDPYLYDVRVICDDDEVETYFGLRNIEVRNIEGVSKLFLNNKEVFLNGILEQGYYKYGLYTPDSYDTVYNDILTIKEMGFNTIRKHIKIEPYLYYYFCDKLGMLVIQDMVNGGDKYNNLLVKLPVLFNFSISDDHYGLFRRKNSDARNEFEKEMVEVVNNLYNFPSICMWTIFNEGWGQFDSDRLYKILKEIDKTRLVDVNSGWFDQKNGDIKSTHCYFKKYKYKKDCFDRAVILSEYGGFSFGKGRKFSYGNFKSEKEYLKRLKECIENEIIPAKEEGLCGAIYTQYNDIEKEQNGVVFEGRKVKSRKIGEVFKKINGDFEK